MKKLLILAVAVMVTCVFTLPAAAQEKAEWNFYGQVRMYTSWEKVSDDSVNILTGVAGPGWLGAFGYQFSGNPSTGTIPRAWTDVNGNVHDDSQLQWELQGNSRIGANVKWGNISGRFEYGAGPNLRLLYGTWNFGPGSFTVGQDYTPWFYIVSNMCGPGGGECNGIGFGTIYGGRQPQLKLDMGGFSFALVKYRTLPTWSVDLAQAQATAGTPEFNPYVANVPANIDTSIPKIEASYKFTLGPVGMFIGGAYNTQSQEYSTPAQADNKVSVDGWELGFGFRSAFGPFYANGSFTYAQNPNQINPYVDLIPSIALTDPAGNDKQDASYYAGQLILGFKLTDAMAFEGGIIYQHGENTVPASLGPATDFSQQSWIYYLQMLYSPAKNVYIVPEIGIIDYDKLKVDGIGDISLGDQSWFGIKWQISF